ncbi:MAG: hypothetical protein GY719_41730 [bacterium]|nr:hypothetical protein [bacterium]
MDASRKRKNRAIEAHQDTFSWVASNAESLFRLAGEHELADSIRPSRRRPGRRAAEDADGESQSEGSQQNADASDQDSSEASAGNGSSSEPAGQPEPTATPAVATSTEPAPSTDG